MPDLCSSCTNKVCVTVGGAGAGGLRIVGNFQIRLRSRKASTSDLANQCLAAQRTRYIGTGHDALARVWLSSGRVAQDHERAFISSSTRISFSNGSLEDGGWPRSLVVGGALHGQLRTLQAAPSTRYSFPESSHEATCFRCVTL